MDKLIINAAMTGMVPTKADNPHVPITVPEIIADARRCRDAGASILHVHARDENGQPTYLASVYEQIITGIRRQCPDLILCVSTSGRLHGAIEQRSQVLHLPGPAKPDMASLTLGSLNFPKQASVNPPQIIHGLATLMQQNGIVPELEVFDLGMVDYARYLIDKQILVPPYYVNILLGSLGTLAATPMNLALLVQALPQGFTWAAAGIGRFQFAVNSWAITTGGHVRVGLEDNLWFDDDRTEPATNLKLIERLVKLARAAGRQVATPRQAANIIGLPPRPDLSFHVTADSLMGHSANPTAAVSAVQKS